jgi:hypothetical protein
MPIPDYQSIIASSSSVCGRWDGTSLARQRYRACPTLQPTQKEVDTLLPSGQDYLFGNRLGWARTYLKKAGLIEYPSRGKFRITDEGRSVLKEQPIKIDVALLKRYPDFFDFWNGTPKEERGPNPVAATDSEVVEETPEELIASAHQKLRKQIQSELLSKVMSCSPAYFERLGSSAYHPFPIRSEALASLAQQTIGHRAVSFPPGVKFSRDLPKRCGPSSPNLRDRWQDARASLAGHFTPNFPSIGCNLCNRSAETRRPPSLVPRAFAAARAAFVRLEIATASCSATAAMM